MVRGGELGEIRRVIWIITDWFRTEFYYNSGGWRATWEGEGGGRPLETNARHNIDLMQWDMRHAPSVCARSWITANTTT